MPQIAVPTRVTRASDGGAVGDAAYETRQTIVVQALACLCSSSQKRWQPPFL
jgi:hypothetical protein